MQQTTLAAEAIYNGIGLHSGREVHMTLKPAPADTGLVFVRTDLEDRPTIRATAANVTSTMRATTVEENGCKVFTIEHLMSAFHAMGIDNCYIEIDAEEPPVADGSSLAFFQAMKQAGVKELAAERREIVIDKVYRIDDEEKNRFVMVLPYDGFRVSFTSVNPHKLIGIQYENFEIAPELYEREIAPARTIAYEKEIEALRSMGLGLGGTLESVIVYNDEGWLNPLHFEDELVRHKILDVIGDLRLAGSIRGHVIAVASGHALNTALAKELQKSLG
ncbi:putative UDP-3-O-[3-hydroxymyristoyl] N-acetylglucosamine deacetylase [Selenomonas ruminantium subsp. lactilytica TAM6421]|uniref:UDP-3-O-acyl-N-acetylglucosamine deacetylase n=1 Tax=Selenomonas ruminantium subsp. lactilytica (strain NBRC 103574 / TAM6421) TaxID=927704 RepID=I0GU70_SELRL|nr:UDP-3-O-acyl-N-acetylglucosamine deacetylase [Selenomonas ruminantium]BAL84307.1 putative UDP-3-O-[3-hydroxymyristoyl] N-acetylglucosamine deacetylase [Selenomonas ruminantium subsp. lactilytica TAM6421]